MPPNVYGRAHPDSLRNDVGAPSPCQSEWALQPHVNALNVSCVPKTKTNVSNASYVPNDSNVSKVSCVSYVADTSNVSNVVVFLICSNVWNISNVFHDLSPPPLPHHQVAIIIPLECHMDEPKIIAKFGQGNSNETCGFAIGLD